MSELSPARSTPYQFSELPAGLGHTDEHLLLRENLRRLLSEKADLRKLRRVWQGEEAWDRELYRELAAQGLLSVSTASDGLGAIHLAILGEEMGRVLLPSPFVATLLALFLLAGDDPLREALDSGATRAAVAMLDAAPTLEAREHAGGWTLQGRVSHVLWGAAAEVLLAPARLPNGELLLARVLIPAAGAEIEAERSLDHSRPSARVRFEDVAVGRADGTPLATGALERYATLARLFFAAEMLGAADRVLELTRVYACERRQFDRPIGAFQAVKHPLVNLLIGVELGRSLLYGGAAALDAGLPEAELSVRMAKARASDVLTFAVERGVQLHGGFGFTWDADLHFFFKRMLGSRAAFGDANEQRRAVADELFRGSE